MIVGIRTESEITVLCLFKDDGTIDKLEWEAHRTLAATIHQKLHELLQRNGGSWRYITGVVCYQGPGSFTGLRIGLTVANALAYGLHASIVGTTGDDWFQQGVKRLGKGEDDQLTLPEYGADAHITKPRK